MVSDNFNATCRCGSTNLYKDCQCKRCKSYYIVSYGGAVMFDFTDDATRLIWRRMPKEATESVYSGYEIPVVQSLRFSYNEQHHSTEPARIKHDVFMGAPKKIEFATDLKVSNN